MAPELLLNSETVAGKCDIWSLGVIAYELLYGECPFETNELLELVHMVKEKDIVFPDDINPE